MTLSDLLPPTFVQMLAALSGWLDKAEGQLPADEAQALLAAQLAPDMFPLSTQIRFACVQALEGMHRLRGEGFRPLRGTLLDEGRNAAENPGSLNHARSRIAETIAVVSALSGDASVPGHGGRVAHDLPNGMIFDLSAEQYARDWALGQFYFHVTIAYAILRNQGIALGKADYVAHMFQYLRPGTMPSQ